MSFGHTHEQVADRSGPSLINCPGTVTMWSPNMTTPLVKMLCHEGPVRSIACDKMGQYMATSGNDGHVKIWDLRYDPPLQCAACISVVHSGSSPDVVSEQDLQAAQQLLLLGPGEQPLHQSARNARRGDGSQCDYLEGCAADKADRAAHEAPCAWYPCPHPHLMCLSSKRYAKRAERAGLHHLRV